MKKISVPRKRENELLEEYNERFKQYKKDKEQYEDTLPLESLTLIALKRKCKKKGLMQSGKTKEELIQRIKRADEGVFVAESRTKEIYIDSDTFVPVEFTEPVLSMVFEAGNNAVIEHIPKPIWIEHILPFLLADEKNIYDMRVMCKYFYVVCTPVLLSRSMTKFGLLIPDFKIWSLYFQMCSEPQKSQLNENIKRLGNNRREIVDRLSTALAIYGSTRGIALKLKSLEKYKIALKQQKRYAEEKRQERLDQFNEALLRIGETPMTISKVNAVTIFDKKILIDLLRFLEYTSIYKRWYRVECFIKEGSYSKEVLTLLSLYCHPDVIEFSNYYKRYCNDLPNADTRFKKMFEEYQETKVMPDFDNLLKNTGFFYCVFFFFFFDGLWRKIIFVGTTTNSTTSSSINHWNVWFVMYTNMRPSFGYKEQKRGCRGNKSNN